MRSVSIPVAVLLLSLPGSLAAQAIQSPTWQELRRAGPQETILAVEPELTNPQAAARALRESYPRMLEGLELEGEGMLWLLLDPGGTVRATAIAESSGHDDLDQSALQAALVFEFSAPRSADGPVAAWIRYPFRFEVR